MHIASEYTKTIESAVIHVDDLEQWETIVDVYFDNDLEPDYDEIDKLTFSGAKLDDLKLSLAGLELGDVDMTKYGEIVFIPHAGIKNRCSLADQFCDIRPTLECFSCGEFICENCSLIVDYYDYGNQRLCHDCCEINNKKLLVMDHLLKLAGY